MAAGTQMRVIPEGFKTSTRVLTSKVRHPSSSKSTANKVRAFGNAKPAETMPVVRRKSRALHDSPLSHPIRRPHAVRHCPAVADSHGARRRRWIVDAPWCGGGAGALPRPRMSDRASSTPSWACRRWWSALPCICCCRARARSARSASCSRRSAMIVAQALLVMPIIAALTRQTDRGLWAEYREELTALRVGPRAARRDADLGRALLARHHAARRLRPRGRRGRHRDDRRRQHRRLHPRDDHGDRAGDQGRPAARDGARPRADRADRRRECARLGAGGAGRRIAAGERSRAASRRCRSVRDVASRTACRDLRT